MLPEDVRRVRAGGLDLAYLDRGAGTPILMIHGFPDVATTFEPLMDRMVNAGYRCIAAWLRGYWPTGLAAFYDEGSLVADALALVQALDIAPVHAVGHDWGADVAYGLATARPDLVRSAVAMAVPHTVALRRNRRGDYDQLKRSWYAWMFQVPGLAEAAAPEADWALVRSLWRDWSPHWEPPGRHLDVVVETLARPGVLTAALGYYRALFDPSLRDPGAGHLLEAVQAGPVKSPTLLLMGERDGCISPAMADGSEESFEGPYEIEVLEGCGHFLHLERPEQVAGRILAWFEAHG